jgi:DUF1009 family protein
LIIQRKTTFEKELYIVIYFFEESFFKVI